MAVRGRERKRERESLVRSKSRKLFWFLSLSLYQNRNYSHFCFVFVFRLQISLSQIHSPKSTSQQKVSSFAENSRGFFSMIARILAGFMESPAVAAAGDSVLGTIKIAVMPIAKVFTMCFLGLLMASKYVNILPPSGRKLLNGVKFLSFFIFCLSLSLSDSQQVCLCPVPSWSSRFCFPA